ncbi:MAG: hypothetical protein D6706_18060 [Chloroflexi bacterium]|nr:MAG: hypothetical protein D6706_18060 [Chloroflexota bacterium]
MSKEMGKPILVFVVLLGVMGLACVVPGIGSATPVATPTPLGDTISFTIPAYTISLEPGEVVPGTQIEYVGRAGDVYKVKIDGLEANKRSGDSLIWNGVIAPGVFANYNLRLTTAVFGEVPVAGPVQLLVFNPEPTEIEASELEQLTTRYHFGNIVINYFVPAGSIIPGTTILFEGLEPQPPGSQSAQQGRLAGLSGYPLVALGDSLVWTGRLRDNVTIRYNLRVASLSEDGIRLAGTAELWITE